MSESIFETFTDERGNITVRVSQEVQVLTREEANRIAAEYKRMQAENAKLRKRVTELEELEDGKRYIPQEWYQLATIENSKQRELLLHMQTCMEHLEYPEYDCSKCPMDNSTGNCDFERRMQELGIFDHDGQ